MHNYRWQTKVGALLTTVGFVVLCYDVRTAHLALLLFGGGWGMFLWAGWVANDPDAYLKPCRCHRKDYLDSPGDGASLTDGYKTEVHTRGGD